MNRGSKESAIAGRNTQHCRSLTLSLNGASSSDYNLDLFSRSRRSLSVASTDDPDVKLGRLSVGIRSTELTKNGLDDLLSTTDGGKHDYDWLLTPPGTPIFPSSGGNEPSARGAPKNSSLAKSVTTIKASRFSLLSGSVRSSSLDYLMHEEILLSVSQSSESNNRPRSARSSSVTRSSVSTFQHNLNKSSSMLNTSCASVNIRSSTPNPRSSSTGRPSTPSARPIIARSSTPVKISPSQNTSDPVRPSQNSRPSTPKSRSQMMANSNSVASRPTSRPSTPTRRNLASQLPAANGPSTSVGRTLSSVCSAASTSRPSSPGPRVPSSPLPVFLPDFPLETPPNLRTTLPDRPLSAGRSRPGVAVTIKGNAESLGTAALPVRPSSPVDSRRRVQDPSSRGRVPSSGQVSHTLDSNRNRYASDLLNRKPVKTSKDSSGIGRSVAKKSVDMSIRHMDMRNGSSGIRPVSGSTPFPQSIRSANSKTQVTPTFSSQASRDVDVSIHHTGAGIENGNYISRSSENGNYVSRSSENGNYISRSSENGNHISRSSENGKHEESCKGAPKLAEVDIYESSRYDTILLKEDVKDCSWLHSFDDKSDQGIIFGNGFEILPELFDPL